jgi:polyphosphate glucokinase
MLKSALLTPCAQEKKLTWKQWAKRFDEFLVSMEELIWPDLIILGGGVSKKAEKFIPLLTVQTEVVPAQMLNEAGIVGAAMAAINLTGESISLPRVTA